MAISAGEIEILFRMRDEASAQMATALQKIDMAGMNIGMRMQSLGAGLTMALTVPIAGLGIGVTKFASDFESSFAGVRKTVDATEVEFAQLSQGFRDLSKEIPINVNELNKIGEAAGQLGIEKEAIIGFTEVMAKLGVTTNLSSDQAASSLARLANITQMPQAEFGRLGSTVVDLGNKFATTEAEIVDFGLRIAGAGKQAGISEAGILAIGAAMSSVGVQAEAGGTAVQKVLIEMVKASAQGAEGFATFARTAGMSAQEFATVFEKDAATAFRMFVEGLGREGKNAVNILAELGLEDQRLIRSFLALSGAGDLLERTLGEASTAWRENTALSEEARKRFETTASQLTLLWNRIKDVAITIGNALLPMIKQAIGALDGLIPIIEKAGQLFVALPTPVKLLAVGLGLVLAAAGPLFYALGQLVMAAGALSGLMAARLNPALAASAGHHHAAAAGATANATATTSAGTAATSASTAFKLLATQALAAFVVFESLPRILKAVGLGLDMLSEKNERDKGQALEQARRYAIRAEASKIAERAILDHGEAVEILEKAGRDLADVQAGEIVYLKTAGPEYEKTARAVRLTAEQIEAAGKAADDAAEATERWEDSKRRSRQELMRMDTWLTKFNQGLSVSDDELLKTTEAMMKLGQVIAKMPIIAKDVGGDLAKMLVPLKEAAKMVPTTTAWQHAWGSMKDGLKGVLDGLPQLFTQAFTGGGGIMGAIKAIGVQIAEAIAKPIFEGITSAIQKALAKKVTGSVTSSLVGGTGDSGGMSGGQIAKYAAYATVIGAIGIGIFKLVQHNRRLNDEIKKYNAEIDILRQGLLKQHGTLANLEEQAKKVGLSFEANWGHQGRAGLEAFNDLIEEFERRTRAAAEAQRDLTTAEEELARLRQDAKHTFAEMQADADLLGINFAELGPIFQQAKIDETSEAYINALDRMITTSGDAGAILSRASGNISELVQQALQFGTTLPENMRTWIEELQRAGLLVDENGDALKGLENLKFGERIKTESEIIAEAMSKLEETINRLAEALLNLRMPPLIDLPGRSNGGDDPTRRPTIPEFAGGSGGQLIDFGRESLVRLHGRERIQTEAEVRGGNRRLSQPIQVVLPNGRALLDFIIDEAGDRFSVRGR